MKKARLAKYVWGCLALVLHATPLLSAEPRMITLEAKQNEFVRSDLSAAQESGEATVVIQLTPAKEQNSLWRPAATIGFSQDVLRKSSFQVRLLQEDETRESLQLKYILYDKGRIARQETINPELPLTSHVRINIAHKNGRFNIMVDKSPVITINTTLTTVTPYIAAVSSKAVFEIVTINSNSEQLEAD